MLALVSSTLAACSLAACDSDCEVALTCSEAFERLSGGDDHIIDDLVTNAPRSHYFLLSRRRRYLDSLFHRLGKIATG